MLEIVYGVEVISEDFIGRDLVAVIRELAESGQSRQEKARASFQMSLLASLNRVLTQTLENEPLYWIAHAAYLGDEAALLLAWRIFEARQILPPQSLLQFSALSNELAEIDAFLRRQHPIDYYSNAVRLLWSRELRKKASKMITESRAFPFHVIFEDFNRMALNPDIKAKNHSAYERGQYPIHTAVCTGDRSLLRRLLRMGYSVNSQNEEGLTPLHLACMFGDLECVFLLLLFGGNASIKDKDDVSPLHFLILFPEHKIPAIAVALVKGGAKVDSSMKPNKHRCFDNLGLITSGTPLLFAVSCRNHAAISTLLSLGANAQNAIKCSLYTACADILEILLQQGNLADHFTNKEKVDLYCAISAFAPRSNDFQHWCMHGPLYEGMYTELFKVLIKFGVTLDDDISRGRVLQVAAISSNSGFARELIHHGAHVDYCDGEDTPLTAAILSIRGGTVGRVKNVRMIELLLENGASIFPANPSAGPYKRAGQPALFTALRSTPLTPVVELLARKMGKDINTKYYGQTALHVLGNYPGPELIEIATLLLSLGADPNIESEHNGFSAYGCCLTPITYAVAKGNWGIIRLYLERECTTDCGISGGHHFTIIHSALWDGFGRTKYLSTLGCNRMHEDFFRLLLSHRFIKERNLVNAIDSEGFTPLMVAVMYGLPFYVQILLLNGADMGKLRRGKTVLDILSACVARPPNFVQEDGTTKERILDFYSKGSPASLRRYSAYQLHLEFIRRLFSRQMKSEDLLLESIFSPPSQNTNPQIGLQKSMQLQEG
jgi:ankyrin repeat protein